MNIIQLLEAAERGSLQACNACPWSPSVDASVGFGVSCREHGVDWHKEPRANSMLIVQDPGDTTPHQTGRLCIVHNAKNPSDRTAQQNMQLWNAAVSLDPNNPNAGGCLKNHYWANAIMHGASANTGLRNKNLMETARSHCLSVLEAQIRALRPKVIIATGQTALNSLFDIGLISRRWMELRYAFDKGAYKEENGSWLGSGSICVYGTYHTSARVVNQTLSQQYKETDTEQLIDRKAGELERSDSIRSFRSRYGNPAGNATDRGMRYLLNHWIDIGVGVRNGLAG